MSVPKALAVKNADGSFIVRVFYLPERYTEVLFPHDSQSEQLALEYAEFKNSQRVTGPDSPATQAVLTEYRAMQSNDIHEQLMEKAAANLQPVTEINPAGEQGTTRVPFAPEPLPLEPKFPTPGETTAEIAAEAAGIDDTGAPVPDDGLQSTSETSSTVSPEPTPEA
jgi:hypothetical protein